MSENEFRMLLIARMEEEMVQLMGRESYDEWFVRASRDLLWQSVADMEDGDFKDYILEHFEEITK